MSTEDYNNEELKKRVLDILKSLANVNDESDIESLQSVIYNFPSVIEMFEDEHKLNIQEQWLSVFGELLAIEWESTYYNFSNCGHAVAHFTPISDNPTAAYFTIYHNPDFKKNKRSQYTLDCYDRFHEIDDPDYTPPQRIRMTGMNNIQMVVDIMIYYWYEKLKMK